MKNRIDVLVEKLKLRKIKKPWTYLIVNFIMKLLLVVRKDMIVYNRLSKITYFMVVTEGMLAEGLVRLFRDNVWKLYRLLESVISDNRP